MSILDNNIPAVEPVTLAEAKLHLRVDHNDEDALIASLISAAREHAEQWTQTVIAERAVTVTFDAFPTDGEALELGVWPVKSVSSIQAEIIPSVYQTLPAGMYSLDIYAKPAAVRDTMGWPASTGRSNSVVVNVVAGPAEAPKSVKQAILLLVGHWYDNREAVHVSLNGLAPVETPKGVDALLQPHRLGIGL